MDHSARYTHGLKNFKEIKLAVQDFRFERSTNITAGEHLCTLKPHRRHPFFCRASSSHEVLLQRGGGPLNGVDVPLHPILHRRCGGTLQLHVTAHRAHMMLPIKAHTISIIRTSRVPTHTYCMKVAWPLGLVLLSLSFSCSSCRLYLFTLVSLSFSLSRAKPIISFLLASSSSAEIRLREEFIAT